MEHLVELRRRIFICLIAVGLGVALTWTWVEEIFQFLLVPLQNAADNPELAQMHHRDLTEPFFALLRTALFSGIVLAIPVILFQIWQFVAPGLYSHEKRIALPFVFGATLCFLGGAAFCYFIVVPFGYEFLLHFADGISKPELMMTEYINLTTKLMLVFGAVFEMPIFTTLFARLGLINHKIMLKFWRYALVICFAIGALLTPPDVATQLMLAGPMMMIYFISVGCAYVFGKRPEPPSEEEASSP